MNTRRVAAGTLALVDGAFGVYAGYTLPTPLSILLWLSALLLANSFLCLYGLRIAHLSAAVLSIVLPGAATLAPAGFDVLQFVLLVLSLASMSTNVVAFRASTGLSEQANPMNLPVFG